MLRANCVVSLLSHQSQSYPFTVPYGTLKRASKMFYSTDIVLWGPWCFNEKEKERKWPQAYGDVIDLCKPAGAHSCLNFFLSEVFLRRKKKIVIKYSITFRTLQSDRVCFLKYTSWTYHLQVVWGKTDINRFFFFLLMLARNFPDCSLRFRRAGAICASKRKWAVNSISAVNFDDCSLYDKSRTLSWAWFISNYLSSAPFNKRRRSLDECRILCSPSQPYLWNICKHSQNLPLLVIRHCGVTYAFADLFMRTGVVLGAIAAMCTTFVARS